MKNDIEKSHPNMVEKFIEEMKNNNNIKVLLQFYHGKLELVARALI